MRIYNQAIHVNLKDLTGPGRFSDMDLLEVGNPGMTADEQASHFAVWAMFKSALMISTAAPSMSTATQNILQNKDLIAEECFCFGCCLAGLNYVSSVRWHQDLQVWLP